MSKVIYQNLILNSGDVGQWTIGEEESVKRFGGSLNSKGDWSEFYPPFEPQSREFFDTKSCAITHSGRAWVTLARFLGYRDFLPDSSERYGGVFGGTNQYGTDPHVYAEVVRTYAGLVPQEIMPWTDQMTFDTYYDRVAARGSLPLGEKLSKMFEFGHEWVFPYNSRLTPEQKAAKLQEALTRGTVCVSVSGDYRKRGGKLYKNPGEIDTHWVGYPKMGTIDDSYEPQTKKLVKNYDHDMAKVYYLKRKVTNDKDFFAMIWSLLAKLWSKKS